MTFTFSYINEFVFWVDSNREMTIEREREKKHTLKSASSFLSLNKRMYLPEGIKHSIQTVH